MRHAMSGMAKRSAAMSACGGLMLAFAIGVLGLSASAGEPVNCYSIYIGSPGGDWRLASNWSPVMPRMGDTVCIPGDAVGSLDLPGGVTIHVFDRNHVFDRVRVFDQSRDREGADIAGARIPSRTDDIGGIPSATVWHRLPAGVIAGWESRN